MTGPLYSLPVAEFAAVTASDAPAPGGGSVSALAGALAAALGEMVARLTLGREKYAAGQGAMEALCQAAEGAREQLLAAVEADSRAFDGYMAALDMPKAAQEEKAARWAAMTAGLKQAAQVPMAVAEAAAGLLPHLARGVEQGNPNAVTDALVAVLLARAAVLGALYNVRINLDSIDDPAFTQAMGEKADGLQAQANGWAADILAMRPEITGE